MICPSLADESEGSDLVSEGDDLPSLADESEGSDLVSEGDDLPSLADESEGSEPISEGDELPSLADESEGSEPISEEKEKKGVIAKQVAKNSVFSMPVVDSDFEEDSTEEKEKKFRSPFNVNSRRQD